MSRAIVTGGSRGIAQALVKDEHVMITDDIRVRIVMPGSVATDFAGRSPSEGDDWRPAPEDVAEAVMGLFRHPGRSLPSWVEIRPAKTKR